MARSGLSELITKYRLLVQESGTDILTDDSIQNILDEHKIDLYDEPLIAVDEVTVSGTVYTTYRTNNIKYLEGTASGQLVSRIENSAGSVLTNYTEDVLNGEYVFPVDTSEATYYLTSRYFDFNNAVADGWDIKAAYYSTQFDFQVEGRSFKKSQVASKCSEMAKKYRALSSTKQIPVFRGDYRANK